MIIKYEKVLHVNNHVFTYVIENEKITASYEGESDVFDFTDMPDGIATFLDVETDLAYNPIVTAVRDNGILTVTLIAFSSDW